MSDDNLIVIKKSTVKAKLGNILGKMFTFYIKFNLEITLFWRRLLPKYENKTSLMDAVVGNESLGKWLVSFIRTLLDNKVTALTVSTVSMYIVGQFFLGRISEILMWLSFFNVLTMMFHIMGWIDKLQEK
jgi:hypothetical protein